MYILNLGNKYFNRYLLTINDVFCLIDTGYNYEYPKFLKALKRLKLSVAQIKYLILTHPHADHAGFAQRLLDESGATLICSENALPRVQIGENNYNAYASSKLSLFLSKFSIANPNKFQKFPPVKTENFISPLTQPLKQFGIEFIEFKGHTEADLAIKVDKKLFIGDIAMNGFPSKNNLPLWLENKESLIESWKKILTMPEITTLYPVHGKPFVKDVLQKSLPQLENTCVFQL
jgi:glyoxylase-like metal-dependent hydrolase (beta-lactamase superfamily II)